MVFSIALFFFMYGGLMERICFAPSITANQPSFVSLLCSSPSIPRIITSLRRLSHIPDANGRVGLVEGGGEVPVNKASDALKTRQPRQRLKCKSYAGRIMSRRTRRMNSQGLGMENNILIVGGQHASDDERNDKAAEVVLGGRKIKNELSPNLHHNTPFTTVLTPRLFKSPCAI